MGGPQFPEIKAERVSDTVYRLLRNHIIAQSLKPGEQLKPEELAKSLGVSRTPIHNALVRLVTEGLVEMIPRKGTYVTEITARDIAETLDVRRALEVLACETAVEHVTPADLAEMRRLTQEMAGLVAHASDDTEAALEHETKNLEFHEKLVTLSQNRRLVELHGNLKIHVKIARTRVRAAGWKARLALERQEHEAIVDALEARDVERLKAAVDQHLRRSKDSLVHDVGP